MRIQIDTLNLELATLSAELGNNRNLLDSTRADLDARAHASHELERNIDFLTSELASQAVVLANKTEALAALQLLHAELEARVSRIPDLESQIVQLTQTNTKVQADYAAVDAALAAQREEYASERERTEKVVQALEQLGQKRENDQKDALARFEVEKAAITHSLRASESSNVELRAKVSEGVEVEKTLKNQLEANNAKFRQEATVFENSIVELRVQNEGYAERIVQLTGDAKLHTEREALLLSQVQTLHLEKSELDGQLRSLQDKIAALDREKNNETAEKVRLEETLQAQKTHYEADVATFKLRLDNAEKRTDTQSEELASLRLSNSSLQARLDQVQVSNEALATELKSEAKKLETTTSALLSEKEIVRHLEQVKEGNENAIKALKDLFGEVKEKQIRMMRDFEARVCFPLDITTK